MTEQEIKVGDKVVYRSMYAPDIYAIVECEGKYGGLMCRLCEPITHIEAMPNQLELVEPATGNAT